MPFDESVEVFPNNENAMRFFPLWSQGRPVTYTGIRNGSPLNKGKT